MNFLQYHWFITCKWRQIVSASILGQMCLQSCKQINDRLSRWKCFWRLDINAALR